MAVKNIDNVTIPGFGQYALYSFSYTPGFSDSYGFIEAEFINKTGVYQEINLNSFNFFPIAIKSGDQAINSLGYFTPVSYEISKTQQFKILKVKFADKSILLDRYLVALRGQVGYDQKAVNEMHPLEATRISGIIEDSPNSRIIWVGNSDEACQGAALDEVENEDPCNPCEVTDKGEVVNKLKCDEYYLMNKREYDYSFDDLMLALRKTGLTFSYPLISTDQKFDFVGSAREVLNNICSEIGFAFYYNPVNTSSDIVLINVRAGININVKGLLDLDKKCKVLEESISKSKEGSKDVFGVAAFQKEGEEKEYGCALDSCKKLKLRPFTVSDLFGDGEAAHISKDEIIGLKANLPRRLEFYSTLTGKISSEFRDLFMWTMDYGFKTAEELETNGKDKKLVALNGMTVKKVFAKTSADTADKHIYRLLLRLYSSKEFSEFKDRVNTKKTYFFLAEVDEIANKRVHNVEQKLCDSFLGQYWIRAFKQHWIGLSYSALTPDGNIQYYDYRSPINLPFADIVEEALGSLKESPLLQRDGIATGKDSDSLKAQDTFYLMTRPAAFYPAEQTEETKIAINKNVEDYSFSEITMPTELEGKFKKMADLNYDPLKHKLFVVEKEFGEANIDLSMDQGTHPAEQENVIIPINACNKSTSYGLADADAIKFDLTFKDFQFSIYMPVQAHNIGESDQPHDGYLALIERNGNEVPVTVPKIEIFAPGAIPSVTSANIGVEFNAYNATNNDLKYLAKVAGEQYCDLDAAQITSLLNTLTALMNYPIGHSEERNYKVEGVPYDFYRVEDGLKSFSINVGASGLITSISFNNSFPFKLSPEQFLKKLKYMRLKQIKKQFVQGKPDEDKDEDLEEV